MLITSKSNSLIKSVAMLADKKYRKRQNLYIVEGVKPVRECIDAGCDVEKIICLEKFAESFAGAVTVTESVFKSISSEKTPQGIMAIVKIPSFELEQPDKPCLLLDNVQDPGNMGTIIRTANASGYESIYMIDCADPYSTKAVRASMSGIFFVKIYQGARKEVLSVLAGVPLICADMSGEDVFSFRPPQKYCLCIGNEGSGIGADIKKIATNTVRIPMRSTCESLNAAVSAGIAMYALKNNL